MTTITLHDGRLLINNSRPKSLSQVIDAFKKHADEARKIPVWTKLDESPTKEEEWWQICERHSKECMDETCDLYWEFIHFKAMRGIA